MTQRDPYTEGNEAYRAGKPETANPYDLNTDDEAHTAWAVGWLEAQENDFAMD